VKPFSPSTPWRLDPRVTFLNHGSFGARPAPVIEAQQRWRDRMDAEPIHFLDDELEGHLDAARAMIGDFGLAVAADRSRLTQAGMMVGTVSYMPPEQATGGEVTPRSDLYSLGAMLYELVTGRPPFVGDEAVAIIGQHLNTPPVAPTWHRPDCPPGLEALILRLLEKDPSKRPSSAGEVREALGHIADVALHPSSPALLPQDYMAGGATTGE